MSIKKIILLSLIAIQQDTQCFSLMLDPAGDAKYTGRSIGNTFERSITMQMAQHIKEQLEENYPTVSVTLTRTPGEIIHPLQNANFANRLSVDLYINLSCVADFATKPTAYIYSYTNQFAFLPPPSLQTFIPYTHAFLVNDHITKAITQIIKKDLSEQQTFFTVKGVFAFPLKPTVGVLAPAFSIECGLNNQNQWQQYLPVLVHSISTIINHLEQKIS